jgi:hypothetical protein
VAVIIETVPNPEIVFRDEIVMAADLVRVDKSDSDCWADADRDNKSDLLCLSDTVKRIV